MEDKKEQPVPANTPPPQPYFYYHPAMINQQDEISLVDIWRILLRQWKWIAASIFLSLVGAVAYLATAIPIYRAEATLLPSEAWHVQALNIPGINEISPEVLRIDLFNEFVINLRSSSLRRLFFDDNNLYSILDGENSSSYEHVFQSKFNNAINLRQGSRDDANFVFVTYQGENPVFIADWLNEFIELVARKTIEARLESITKKVLNQKEILNEQIRISRESAKQKRLDKIAALEEQIAITRGKHRRQDRLVMLDEQIAIARNKQRRQDRIALLDEQIAIARELNIINRNEASPRALEGNNSGVTVSLGGEPLYMRGVKDLTAEKEALEKREDDDPFIAGLAELVAEREALERRKDDDPFIFGLRELIAEQEILKKRTDEDSFISGIRDMQAELKMLESGLQFLMINSKDILAVRVDQKATPPKARVKPKRKQVLALSLVLGGMVGVLSAFLVNFIGKKKGDNPSTPDGP